MYKFLLNNTDKDVITLLEHFLENFYNTTTTIDCLEEDLGWSYHRLMSAINRAKDLHIKYPTFILEVKHQSVNFSITHEFLLSKFSSIILEETVYFNLLDHFFKKGFISLVNISQQYFYSERTIQRKLKEIEKVLSNYEIQLKLRSNKVFEGSEHMIRFFFHSFYWQIFDEEKELQLGMSKLARENLKKLLSKHNTKFRNIDIDKFSQIVSISFYRVRKNNVITEIPKEMTKINHAFIRYDFFKKEILEPIAVQSDLSTILNEKEYIFLYYMFSAITTYLPEDIDENINIQVLFSVDDIRKVLKVITKVEKTFNLCLKKAEKNYLLINMLTVNSTSNVFATKQKMDVFGKSTTDLDYTRVLPGLYPKVKLMYEALIRESKTFEQLYKANERIIFQYSMILSLLVEQKRKNKIRIFHESKFGKIQDKRQKQKINAILESSHVVFVTENPDIVLTDYPVDKSKYLKNNKRVKFFLWKSFQSHENWIDFIAKVEAVNTEMNEELQ